MTWQPMLLVFVVGWAIGRAYQKWADGTFDYENEIYQKGREDGYSEGYADCCLE